MMNNSFNINQQHRAVTMALREIQGTIKITEEEATYLRHFMNCLYDLGRREGRNRDESKMKAVAVYFNGRYIDTYASISYTAKMVHLSDSTVSHLIRSGGKCRKGYSFKFA